MMTMLKVSNCPKCGKVFQNNLRNLCQECIRSYDDHLDLCLDHLKYNRKATTEQLAGATGIAVQQIYAFIKENRLAIDGYPNLTYPCTICSAPIRQHHLCVSCRIRLITDINKMKEQSGKAQQRERGIGFQIGDRFSRI